MVFKVQTVFPFSGDGLLRLPIGEDLRILTYWEGELDKVDLG